MILRSFFLSIDSVELLEKTIEVLLDDKGRNAKGPLLVKICTAVWLSVFL